MPTYAQFARIIWLEIWGLVSMPVLNVLLKQVLFSFNVLDSIEIIVSY